MKKYALILGLGLLTGTHLSGCTKPVLSEEVLQRVASAAWLTERRIPAGPFALTAFERMHAHNAEANIYFEGDGKAWISRKRPSLDPTPTNPVGLHLATRDSGENVAYLARPCQYTKLIDREKACDIAYWTNRRFSPEVIDAYNIALDNMKARYDITGFNLIGFSGGGTVAALLAAEREDVLTLRTVAGNLDHRFHSEYHKISYLEGSLNPTDFSARLARIPQVHFIGGQDQVVPPNIAQHYLQALGPNHCARLEMIQESGHEAGWVDKWPQLLLVTPTCPDDTPQAATGFIPPLPGRPAFSTVREQPEKP